MPKEIVPRVAVSRNGGLYRLPAPKVKPSLEHLGSKDGFDHWMVKTAFSYPIQQAVELCRSNEAIHDFFPSPPQSKTAAIATLPLRRMIYHGKDIFGRHIHTHEPVLEEVKDDDEKNT